MAAFREVHNNLQILWQGFKVADYWEKTSNSSIDFYVGNPLLWGRRRLIIIYFLPTPQDKHRQYL